MFSYRPSYVRIDLNFAAFLLASLPKPNAAVRNAVYAVGRGCDSRRSVQRCRLTDDLFQWKVAREASFARPWSTAHLTSRTCSLFLSFSPFRAHPENPPGPDPLQGPVGFLSSRRFHAARFAPRIRRAGSSSPSSFFNLRDYVPVFQSNFDQCWSLRAKTWASSLNSLIDQLFL